MAHLQPAYTPPVKKHDQELGSNNHEVPPLITLWDGPKNFWKQRQNVEMRIVEHTAQKVVEIICFNPDLCAESPRIFLDSKKLYARLDSAEIDEKVNNKREELARMRKRVPLEEMKEVIVKDMAVQYIQARLQIVAKPEARSSLSIREESTTSAEATGSDAPHGGDAAPHAEGNDEAGAEEDPHQGFYVEMLPLSGDTVYHGKLDVILLKKPDGLEDIVIPRRKKTTMQDFHKEMRALRAEHAQLNAASATASRKAGLAVQSTDAFKGMLRSRSTLDESHLSIATKRWLWAGRRVILQNYVAAVHQRLERYSLSALPSESITKEGQALKDKLNALGGGRSMRGSQSSLKLPSLADSSKDARRSSRSSKDGNPLSRSNSSNSSRAMQDFSKSLSVQVQARVEERKNGVVRRSRTESFEMQQQQQLLLQRLPAISSPTS
jgi:hypothetical protein